MVLSARCVTLAVICVLLYNTADAWQTPTAKASAAAGSTTVKVGDQENGKDIDLTSGGVLIVSLSSNPSTGYRWAVAGDPSPLKLQKASFRKQAASPQLVGAPGVQVFRFSANSAGMATLTLNYSRSWEYNVRPAKTFSVRVKVR